ncbi:hypothetical protein M8J76_010445 [Diaphorina citri]|nr:hypothetical protein M8J76_010445 [Diaphorina citri]
MNLPLLINGKEKKVQATEVIALRVLATEVKHRGNRPRAYLDIWTVVYFNVQTEGTIVSPRTEVTALQVLATEVKHRGNRPGAYLDIWTVVYSNVQTEGTIALPRTEVTALQVPATEVKIVGQHRGVPLYGLGFPSRGSRLGDV